MNNNFEESIHESWISLCQFKFRFTSISCRELYLEIVIIRVKFRLGLNVSGTEERLQNSSRKT